MKIDWLNRCYAYPNSLPGAIDQIFMPKEERFDNDGFETLMCYIFTKGWVVYYWVDEMLELDWYYQLMLFLLPVNF